MKDSSNTTKQNRSEVPEFATLPLDSFHLQSKLIIPLRRSEKLDYTTENEIMYVSEIKVSETIPTTVRIIFLILLSVIPTGLSYHIYSITTLQDQIESSLGISETSYNLIIALTIAPSVILPFFLGGLIDKIGSSLGLTIGTLIFFFGDTIILYAFYLNSLYAVYVGCLFIGLGIDVTFISHIKMIQKWFRGKHLSLALGFIATIASITSVVANIVAPLLYNVGEGKGLILVPIGVQCLVSLLSVVMAGVLFFFDGKYNHIFVQNALVETNKTVELKVVKHFPQTFWFIATAAVCGYSTIMGTNFISYKFLQEKFNLSPNTAGIIRTIPQFVVLFLSPIMGKITDLYGKKLNLLMAAYLILWSTLMMSAFFPSTSNLIELCTVFVLQGIFSSIHRVCPFAAMMLIIKTQHMGVASGLYCWFNGVMLSAVMFADRLVIAATETDRDHGYFWVFLLLAVFPTVAFGLILYAKIKDSEKGSVLEEVPSKIRASIFARGGSFKTTHPQSEEK